jgi:uncharacterized DUF497 family protein
VDFEWDPAKAASNLAKHGVDFEDAMRYSMIRKRSSVPTHVTVANRDFRPSER